MKQTAVDWFYNRIKSHFEDDGDILEAIRFAYAIALTKEVTQITEAHDDKECENGVQYYTRTFLKEKP